MPSTLRFGTDADYANAENIREEFKRYMRGVAQSIPTPRTSTMEAALPKERIEATKIEADPLGFLAPVNEVENRLVDYARRGGHAIPEQYLVGSHPQAGSYRGRMNTDRYLQPDFNKDTKAVAENLLTQYFGKGHAKAPQLNPEETFKSAAGIEIVPGAGSFGAATVYPESLDELLPLLSNYYHSNKLMPYGGGKDFNQAIEITSDLGKYLNRGSHPDTSIDEIWKYIAGLTEHEGAHVNILGGTLTPREKALHDYMQEIMAMRPDDGGRLLSNEVARSLKPGTGRHLELGYQHRPIETLGGGIRARGGGGSGTSWTNNPNESLAETIGMGRTVPGEEVSQVPTSSLIQDFLKYGNTK